MTKVREVATGLQIGKLVVGDKTTPKDPRVAEARTPMGYISHGSLRECFCEECQRICFISTYILERRNLQNCGCKRLKKQRENYKASGGRTPEERKETARQMRVTFRKYKLARLKGNIELEIQYYDEMMALRKGI